MLRSVCGQRDGPAARTGNQSPRNAVSVPMTDRHKSESGSLLGGGVVIALAVVGMGVLSLAEKLSQTEHSASIAYIDQERPWTRWQKQGTTPAASR